MIRKIKKTLKIINLGFASINKLRVWYHKHQKIKEK